MAEITVDVGVRLKAMQSSVADLQKVLDGLQPNSSGFKALQKIITDINRDIDRLRIQTSKPFGSQNQFSQTEKTVDKLEESLEKVKITIDRIKFSDLKLDSSQTAQLDNFKQQLKDIKQEFTNFKADLKDQFLDNDFNKAFVEGINPNLLNKNFDEIVKNVNNKVDNLGLALARAKTELENFQNATKIGEKLSKASKATNGIVSQDFMGQELFDKFFQTNSKGIFSFKTGGGLKKGEIQQQFLNYLTEEFQLTQTQVDQLKNQTASNIRKILAQDDFFNPQKKAAETANKKMSGAESTFTNASKDYENAAAVVARLTPLLSALSNEELSLEDKQKLVNQAIRQFEQDCVNGAKGSKTLQDSTKGLSSGLESFKQQLGQVNTQWLNLQKQQATFNSMKSAIVNFMGFNQVLNITKKAVKEAMNHIKQLDTTMNGIAIVTNMTTADLWKQVDVYSEMAQRYGTSIQGAYEVSKIYYQAGYETNEVLTLMNETLKMSKISGLDYATTTDYMMNAIKGFKMEVADAASVVDVYSALAANTAVSQQELAEAMSKTASSMAGVGSTFEDTSAMIATMVSVTRESANNIGSAMKSIASRYGELTKDPTKLLDAEGEAMSFNKVDTALKSVGITLQTTDHQFRDFTDVIVELAEKWDTLDSAQQRYIATQFAGNRQQNRFLALVSNKDLLKENMEVAAASEDTGTLQALKALDSLESKLNQVQVAYQQFYTTIGVENVWKAFLDGTENVINTLNNLPKLFGKIPVGAIAVIYDIISLIKTAALNGLSEIASIWIQKTQEMTAQTQSESGKNRDNGTTWVDNFISGIRSRIGEIGKAAREAVDAANQEARNKALEQAKQNNPQPNSDFNASRLNDLVKQYDKTSGADQLQASTAIMNEYGMTVNSARSALEAYAKISQQAAQATEEAGQTALSGGQKFLVGAQGIAKAALSSKKLASTTSGLAMGLNTIAMLMNTTSESGKHLAGTLMIVAGGLRAVGAVLQYVGSAGQMAFPWMAVITGVIGIVNGISTAYETAQEKLERLKKEAEELNNEAKKAKAEYNTLQRTADKLDELKEKRYESAEAAEEYQKAVDDLAEKFPQLISSLDDAGNVIINTSNVENILAKAREETTRATLNAAKSEIKLAEEKKAGIERDIEEEHARNMANILTTLPTMETAFEGDRQGRLLGLGSTLPYGPAVSEEDILINLTKNKPEYDFLKKYIDSNNIFNLDQFKTDLNENKISVNDEESQQALANLKEIYQEADSQLNEKINNMLEKAESLQGLTADELLQSENQKILKTLKEDLDSLANQNADLSSFSKQISDTILALSELSDVNNSLSGFETTIASLYVNAVDDTNKIYTIITENAQVAALATQRVVDKIENDNLDVNNEGHLFIIQQEAVEAVKEYQEFWNKLNNNQQEQFNSMLENMDKYSLDDILTTFGNFLTEPIINDLKSKYEEANENIKTRVLENIKANLGFNSQAYDKLFNSVKQIDDTDFSELDAKFINTVIAPLNKLSKQGFLNKANELEDATEELFSSLNELDAISSTAVLDIITKNGLLTKEGINASIKAIQSDSSLNTDVVNKSLTFLETVRTTIIDNINVSIQAATSDLLNNWDTTSKELTKALSGGLDFKEADALITKAASLGVSLDLNTDFVQNGDKLILTSEKFNEYWKKLNEQSQKNADEWQQNIDQAYSLIEKIVSDFDYYNFSEDEKAIIESISPDFFNNDEYFTINGYLNTAGFEALGKAIKESSEGLERYNTYAQMAAEELKRTQDWIEGNYKETEELKDIDLKELASGNIELGREEYNLRAARDNINSAYNSLISDILSKGFENINLEDYSGLVFENKAAIEEAIKAGNYEQFIKDYAVWAGKSITETNALITQAIAKDTQTTIGAAKDAISKLSWGPGARGFGSLSDIQALADSFNVPIESILGAYNEELNQYSFDASSLDLTSVDDFSDIVRDSIAKFIKDSFSNATKAITGKLTSSEATVFKGQLDALKITDLNLDFTRTTDGLKLSRQSAIDLYNELKNIDALQAQLVFSELSKSLQENDANYTNISTTLARIAELENEIKEMKPDDARLQMYKNELSVAQEIARTRSSTDNKDFNFMDRALPTGMQNPIDYWNSTGEAFKAMNNAAKTGKMEIQDFYNIVQEMNNMAAVSGQTLQFMGQSLSGKAEDAASLIQAGFSALTNVKGDGVKIALGNIGTDFTTGAEAMKGDFDDGVRSMAKAQISMLDAAINMLEAIVAMEDIGDIDTSGNGEIEFGELFKFDKINEIWEYDENAQTTIDKILEAADKNSELKNVLNSFYLDGYSLYELMQNKSAELTKIGDEGRQALLKAFNIINDLANSDEWDPTNLDKIYQLLEQSGLKDIFSQHVYNEAAQMSVLITPDLDLQIDWDAPNIEEKLATAQVKTKEEARTILDDLAKGDTDPVKFAQALALAGQVTIDDNNVYKYHGQDFSSLEEVGKIAQEESKLDAYFVSSDTNTTTFTKTIGLQQVTIVTDENSGDITYKFADGIEITAKNEEEALHLYAQKIRDEHDSLINVSDEEILARRNLKIKEQVKIEFIETENSGSLKQQAEIIRQHTVKEINEAIENGHQEGENLVIDLGGQKITLKGTQESLKGQGEEIANQAAQDLGIDTALSQAIADGISQAFQGESGAKIGEAIKTGIQTAFGNTGTDADGIPIDNINIKPTTITINTDSAAASLNNIDESGVPIPPITVNAEKVLLSSTNIDDTSLNIPQSIDRDTLKVIYEILKLINPSEIDESNVYTPQYLTEHPEISAILSLLILKSLDGTTEYNEDNVVGPSEGLKKKLDAAATLAKLALSSDSNTEFLQGTIKIGEGKELKISTLLTAIANGGIKINSPDGGSSITEGSISIATGEEEITIPATEFYTIIDKIKTELGSNYQVVKTGVTLTENDLTLDPKELIQPISGIRYVNDFQKSREKVGLNNDWGSIDNNNKLGKDLVTSKNNEYLNYLEEAAKYVGKGGILTSVDWTYLNPLKEMSDVTIPESVLTTLQSIDGLDLTNVKLENGQDLFNLLVQLQQFNTSNSSSFSSVTDSLNTLEVGQLPEIATALQDIANQAQILQGIEWDKIVEGIQNVTSAQVGQSQEGGKNKSGGESSQTTSTTTTNLLDTSSLGTAIGEIDSVIESFTNAVTQVNSVVSAMEEIKADKINDLADAANDIKSTYAENARNAINGISSTNATMAKTAINNISAAGAISAKEAINNISGEISLGINISVNMPTGSDNATGTVDIHSVSSGSATRSSATSVKWSHTHAYAAGNTLMGELGPELVVSNGRYFLVGQSGPEMVNLAEDAIVFNHLQTQQLLKHGKASKYATPVTNERKATSLATGNAGPAMASASDALATLKQLRSMWQSLLDASLQDMGSMGGGSGGGGGGGGGGSSDTEKYVAGITSNVERWYNWLTAIETTQNKINILTKKYNLLSEQGASSKKLADNLGKQYAQLQKSYNIRKQLTKEQKAYQKSLQKDIKSGKSALSAFYQVGEDGSLLLAQDSAFSKYVSKHSTLSKSDRDKIAAGKKVKMTVKKQQAYTVAEAEEYNTKYAEDIKKGTKTKVSAGDLKESTKKTTINVPTSGLELMKELQKTDKYGNLVYSAKEQYSILKKLGFEDYMSKDASGQAIDTSTDEGKATAVESFLSRISADKEEYESITKSIQEQEEAALEERLQMEEINKQLIEMAKPVQGVTEALEHWYNWTRKIVAAQTELTLLGTKYNQLQSQLGDNTDKTLENLEEQIEKTREILSGTQKEREERQTALDERRKAIEESGSYDRLYTFDEKTGSLVYRDKVNGGNNEAVTTVGGPWEPELKAIEEFGEKGAKIVPQKLGDESIAALEDVSNQATQIATDSSNTLFTITEKSIRTTAGGYSKESSSLLADLKTQKEESKLGTLSKSDKSLLTQLRKGSISEKAWKKLSKEQQKYYTSDGKGNYVLNDKGKKKKNSLINKDEKTLLSVLEQGKKAPISKEDYKKLSSEQKKYFTKNADNTYSLNKEGQEKYSSLYSRQTKYNLAKEAEEKYKDGITKEQYDEAKAKIDNFKETDFQKQVRTGAKLTKAEYDKLSNEQKKLYSKGANNQYLLNGKGYDEQRKLQNKYDTYDFYKQIVDAYDTSRVIYDTEEKQVELNTEDPREFLKQLTAKDGNDNSVFTKEQQAEILVQAGYKEQLRHFNGKSYNLEDPEELAQAAADWLEYIQSVPEAYNEALDEMEATKQKEEELKQQILDYNNQIRELLKPTAGVTAQLESWYKWTRQTIDAQKKLNLLTTEYSNLEKSIGDTTKEQVKNLIDQGKQNKIERDANKNEQAAKKAKWEQEVAKVTNNKALGQFLNYDKETETVRYSDTAISGLNLPKTISVNEIKRDKTGREIRINTEGDEITFGQEGYDDERNMVASEKKEYDLSKILGDAINKEGKIDPQKFIENLTQTDEAGNAIYSLELQSAVLEALGITGQDLTIFGDFENWEEANANQRKAAIQAFLEYMPEAAEKVNGLKDAYADSVIEGANLDGQLLDINNDLQKLAETAAGIQNPFEEWHSWIVKIKREQNELNLLSKEYSNNEKERTNNGEKLGDQLIKQLEIYKEQKDTQNAYKEAQEKEYKSLIDNMTEAQKKFFTIDEAGRLMYSNQAFDEAAITNETGQIINENGIKLTGTVDKNGVYEYKNINETIDFTAEGAEDFLKKLTEQDTSGKMKYNTDEQFEILKAFGFGDLMQYDQSGNKIFANGIDNATKEEREAAVKAVLDNLLNFQTTVEKAEDQIQQTSETLVDIDGNIIGIKNQIQDNEIALENKVLQAIEDREQKQIDVLQKQKDMLSEAADNFLNGLSDQLSKEREMYEKQETQNELLKMQRQLAILQRSGGSASQIRGLQEQIRTQQKDMYFDERQEQIDAIKEASDKQIEKLDRQIKIAEESLTYAKENGLYWNEVREIMKQDSDAILSFIELNLAERKSQSTLQSGLEILKDGKIVGTFTSIREHPFKEGGLVNFTGPAWLDGTKKKPESVLTADQTDFLRNKLIDDLELFSLAISQFTDKVTLSNSLNNLNENAGINIEQLDFVMQVESLANDYDARRAGQQAFEEMVRIARKAGNHSISRR